jgi:hypothetical protein
MTVKLIWVATIVSIATYLFWDYFPKGSFYIGNAIFILLISIVIYIQNKGKFISFYLLCIAVNNLMDELLFTPCKLGLNEIMLALILPLFWLIKTYRRCLINWYRTNFLN